MTDELGVTFTLAGFSGELDPVPAPPPPAALTTPAFPAPLTVDERADDGPAPEDAELPAPARFARSAYDNVCGFVGMAAIHDSDKAY